MNLNERLKKLECHFAADDREPGPCPHCMRPFAITGEELWQPDGSRLSTCTFCFELRDWPASAPLCIGYEPTPPGHEPWPWENDPSLPPLPFHQDSNHAAPELPDAATEPDDAGSKDGQ
jgi:hypothetical protein